MHCCTHVHANCWPIDQSIDPVIPVPSLTRRKMCCSLLSEIEIEREYVLPRDRYRPNCFNLIFSRTLLLCVHPASMNGRWMHVTVRLPTRQYVRVAKVCTIWRSAACSIYGRSTACCMYAQDGLRAYPTFPTYDYCYFLPEINEKYRGVSI